MESGCRWATKPPWIGWMPPVLPKVVAAEVFEEEERSEVIEKFGGPCRGRTYGPLIKSQLLYQLS